MMQKKLRTKLLSACMAMVMLFLLLPIGAFAVTTQNYSGKTQYTIGSHTYYDVYGASYRDISNPSAFLNRVLTAKMPGEQLSPSDYWDILGYYILQNDSDLFMFGRRIVGYAVVYYDFNLHYLDVGELGTAAGSQTLENLDPSTPGVTYEQGTSNIRYSAGIRNSSREPVTTSQKLSQSDSTIVENSFSDTKEYSFQEIIGSETKRSSSLPFIHTGVEQTFKAEFTTSQVFSSTTGSSTFH